MSYWSSAHTVGLGKHHGLQHSLVHTPIFMYNDYSRLSMCTNVENSSTHEQTTVDSLSLEEEYWDEGGWDVGYSEVVAVLGTAEAWSEPLATDGVRERGGTEITFTLTNQHVPFESGCKVKLSFITVIMILGLRDWLCALTSPYIFTLSQCLQLHPCQHVLNAVGSASVFRFKNIGTCVVFQCPCSSQEIFK